MPFPKAQIRRFTRRREDAERAIEIAIAALESKQPTSDQLGDLGDAINALQQQQFYVSVLFAHGALHSYALPGNPPGRMPPALGQMKREFHAFRRRSDSSPA